MSAASLRQYRRRDVAMIFQDPRAAINPVRRIGDFLTEALVDRGDSDSSALETVTGLLESVGINDVPRRMRQYPHELSGGLLQRMMIAAALAITPKLLLADEPTTALDVTTQSDVMVNLDTQRRERGLAMIFVTHDLELASAVCDRIAIMYAGFLVEDSPAAGLHREALHPYTAALLASRPTSPLASGVSWLSRDGRYRLSKWAKVAPLSRAALSPRSAVGWSARYFARWSRPRRVPPFRGTARSARREHDA